MVSRDLLLKEEEGFERGPDGSAQAQKCPFGRPEGGGRAGGPFRAGEGLWEVFHGEKRFKTENGIFSRSRVS